jgi:signal transduction histidine kinase
MLFTTPTQFAVLALCVLAGFIFGLATRSGGRDKARLRTLEAEHAAYRKDADARIRAAEVERERMARAAPVTTSAVGVHPQSEAHPADRVVRP